MLSISFGKLVNHIALFWMNPLTPLDVWLSDHTTISLIFTGPSCF